MENDLKEYEVKIFVDPHHRPYRACFKIGVQTFYVCEREDIKEAEVFVTLLKTAFANYALYLGSAAGQKLKESAQIIAHGALVNSALMSLVKHAFTAGRGTSISWEDFAKREGIIK